MHKSSRPHKQTTGRRSRPRAAAELLRGGAPLNDVQVAVAQGAEALERTRAWLCALLPAELGVHVVQALERGGELTVFTESAAWAGRLTLALAERRGVLAPRIAEDARVTVRVIPGGRYRR